MCGNTASLPRVSMIALAALAAHNPEQDTITAGYRVVPSSEPRQVVSGALRAEAVAAHLRIANRELVSSWEQSRFGVSMTTPEATQAGAAATEAFADLLDALSANDKNAARAVIERFVNEAVDSGVVAV